MNPSVAKYLVFLCTAVVVSDARPRPGEGPTVSADKQAEMYAALARRYGDRSEVARQRLVANTLQQTPTFSGGIAFLKRVEEAARRLGEGIETPQRYAVLEDLARIAEADASVSFPELTVIRAVVANIGLPRPHDVDADAGRVLLPGA